MLFLPIFITSALTIAIFLTGFWLGKNSVHIPVDNPVKKEKVKLDFPERRNSGAVKSKVKNKITKKQDEEKSGVMAELLNDL